MTTSINAHFEHRYVVIKKTKEIIEVIVPINVSTSAAGQLTLPELRSYCLWKLFELIKM